MTEEAQNAVFAKTAKGAGWVIGFRLTTRLLGTISTLVLARLLGPGDFGLVALATGFAATVDAFANVSPHEAIVREPSPDRAMYDTAFTMSLLRGLITASVVAAAGPLAGDFFKDPRITPVLFALALSAFIGAVENIAVADFMRTFQFDKEFKLWTLPRLVQVVATIGWAVVAPNYWALVFGILTGRTLRTAMSYTMRPYRPRLTLVAWRRITGFTMWSWAIYVVSVIRDRIDIVLIGRFFTPSRVGIYLLGGEISLLPTSELVDPLCRALFPGFSQLRNEGLHVAEPYLRAMAATSLLVMPAGVGIAMVADPLVRIAFGPHWLEAIPIIQIIGISGTILSLGNISGTLFSAHAMLRTLFSITLLGTLARAGLLALFVPHGTLLTVAIIATSVSFGEQSIAIAIAMHRFAVPARGLVRALWRSVLGAAVMGAALYALGLGLVPAPDAPWLSLTGTALAGIAIYTTAVSLAWFAVGRPGGPERDLIALVRGALQRTPLLLVAARLRRS